MMSAVRYRALPGDCADTNRSAWERDVDLWTHCKLFHVRPEAGVTVGQKQNNRVELSRAPSIDLKNFLNSFEIIIMRKNIILHLGVACTCISSYTVWLFYGLVLEWVKIWTKCKQKYATVLALYSGQCIWENV